MEKPDNLSYKKKIHPSFLGTKLAKIIEDFCECYVNAAKSSPAQQSHDLIEVWLDLVNHQLESPTAFQIYHQAIRSPFDYYQFGLNLIRPLINFPQSQVLGKENLTQLNQQIQNKQNVILLANHQTEPDPQIISLLIEADCPDLAQNMIFVAGHRVINDPLAIPLSLGRNLLCIYSKKHIHHPLEEKSQKIAHNQRTLKKLTELLSQGGHCIYVAPSGGRDRANEKGLVEVAPFDADSLELFHLIAKQSRCPTHFYPLALKTFSLMPPPHQVEKELGETRQASYTPVSLAFGKEIHWTQLPILKNADKQTQRITRAKYITNLVKREYNLLK